jgi:HK97 family phage prohead protease
MATSDRIRAARAEHSSVIPGGAARIRAFPSQLRATLVEKNGKQFYEVEGYATIYDRGYDMYDMFGEYTEIMDGGSLDKSLANSPDVSFLVNHKGVTMARTTNGTLELSSDATGLRQRAWLNADRQDVREIASAINDKLVTEMSFAFMLNEGEWNDDYDVFRILEADVNRGDVSAVNYGANPYTSINARASEWLADADRMPPAIARAALERLSGRKDVSPAPEPKVESEPGTISLDLAEELFSASYAE